MRYGFGNQNDWRATRALSNARGGSDFMVEHHSLPLTHYQLRIPGRHNVLNALAAIAVADYLSVPNDVIHDTLRNFRGAARRFEILGEFNGVTVVDDYAHHPTEIRATLAAARERFPGNALWAVFQPHTYSRTRALLAEFAGAFDKADHVIVTEIFAAREMDALGMSGRDVVAQMNHDDTRFIASLDAVVNYIAQNARAGEVLLTLGAGDVNQVGASFANWAGGMHARTL